MADEKHSPLPWRVKRLEGDHIGIRAADNTALAMWDDWPEREADAAYIVTACNTHHELVAVLRDIVTPMAGGSFRNLTGENAQRALAALAKVDTHV
jgi:hypothetical protein